MNVLGIMSGTSLDGIDLALVEIQGTHPSDFSWRVLRFRSIPYEGEQRRRILEAIGDGTAERICRLHADLGEWFGNAAVDFIESLDGDGSPVRLIGCHGQTIWHLPPSGESESFVRGATLQLGDPATIAERTGIDVVSDFRARDMAAGGHGAPLVPWVDCLMFGKAEGPRCMQNIGGMANVTWIPPDEGDDEPIAFDTGPGNALVDAAVQAMTGGADPFDVDGAIARRGVVDEALLTRLMEDPYLAQGPPKSTGRERYGPDVVEGLARERGLRPGSPDGWADLVATLTEFTAVSIADAYRRWIAPRPFGEIVVSGGGARNPVLLERLRTLLAPTPFVSGTEVLGFDPDAKEAVAFAVLAWAHHRGVTSNLPQATGASRSVVLGSRTRAGDMDV